MGDPMKALKAITVILVATFLGGCQGLTEGKASSEKAIAHIHELYNMGKLEQIWQEADPEFRNASQRTNFDELLGAERRKLGNAVSTSNRVFNVQSFNLTTKVSMTQDTVFEHGKGTEAFNLKMDGSNAVLVGYNIQSLDLITK
jgi:PBP1b-binding outer membrane lipoprotein LpoB